MNRHGIERLEIMNYAEALVLLFNSEESGMVR
jgi:hypothetical protein